MQKLKRCKKGFTLTELAIVIAVIAILIAVLVPTFVSLINSANNSADEQTVKNMNTALSVDEAENGTPAALCGVWEVLEEDGFSSPYKACLSANQFYWYKAVNRIVIVNDNAITFPAEYKSSTLNDTDFISLNLDETDRSAHAIELGTCSVCGTLFDQTLSSGDDFSSAFEATGSVILAEDTTATAGSSLLIDSELDEITLDLNENTLTPTSCLAMSNWMGMYVTEKNQSEHPGYEVGYFLGYEKEPLTVNIFDGNINISSDGYLRFENGATVTIENVSFINTSSSVALQAIQIYIDDSDSDNTYVFKNCTFANTYVEIMGGSGSCYECNVEFENCTFTATLGSGKSCVYIDDRVYGTATFTNCSFTITANGNWPSAIAALSDSNYCGENATNITLENVTFVGTSTYNTVSSFATQYTPIMLDIIDADCVNVTETGTNSYTLDGAEVNYDGTEK